MGVSLRAPQTVCQPGTHPRKLACIFRVEESPVDRPNSVSYPSLVLRTLKCHRRATGMLALLAILSGTTGCQPAAERKPISAKDSGYEVDDSASSKTSAKKSCSQRQRRYRGTSPCSYCPNGSQISCRHGRSQAVDF